MQETSLQSFINSEIAFGCDVLIKRSAMYDGQRPIKKAHYESNMLRKAKN